MKVLVVSTFDGRSANVIRDFLFAFNAYSAHDYYYVFDCGVVPYGVDLSRFDVIVIFWSVQLPGPSEFSEAVQERLGTARALKVQFLQDEYRDVRTVNRLMDRVGIQVMCTCVAAEDHETFYPRGRIPSLESTYTVLTGYVPAYLERRRVNVSSPRPVDVAYRSRAVPYWLGDLGQEKRIVAERFEDIAWRHGLRSDISVREKDRIYGKRWVEFLEAASFILGSASGASVVDFTGEIQRNCERYLAEHPGASYAEVKAKFFADVDGKHVIDTISPRVFEAAALGCTLVLHEGAYGGLLRPDEHYICVKCDYTNIDEVLARMRDRAFCAQLRRRAYDDLIASQQYSYRQFVKWFDGVLEKHIGVSLQRAPVSLVGHYARSYFSYKQRIIPTGGTFVVLPSLTIRAALLAGYAALLAGYAALLAGYAKLAAVVRRVPGYLPMRRRLSRYVREWARRSAPIDRVVRSLIRWIP